jgi:hypothetical protein
MDEPRAGFTRSADELKTGPGPIHHPGPPPSLDRARRFASLDAFGCALHVVAHELNDTARRDATRTQGILRFGYK